MNGKVFTVVDRDRCNGCGLCVEVCPSDTLSMVDGKAAVTADRSMACGQCVEHCPINAVRLGQKLCSRTPVAVKPTP